MSNIAQIADSMSPTETVGEIQKMWLTTWKPVADSANVPEMRELAYWAAVRRISIRELGRRLGGKGAKDVLKYFSALRPRAKTVRAIADALHAPLEPLSLVDDEHFPYVFELRDCKNGKADALAALYRCAIGSAYANYLNVKSQGLKDTKLPRLRKMTEAEKNEVVCAVMSAYSIISRLVIE